MPVLRLARLSLRVTGLLITAAAGLVVLLSIALLVFFVVGGQEAERYTSGIQPRQFYAQLEVDLLDDYAGYSEWPTIRATASMQRKRRWRREPTSSKSTW